MKDIMINTHSVLVNNLFDCECDEDYIQFYEPTGDEVGDEVICHTCGAEFDDCSNSRLGEVVPFLKEELTKATAIHEKYDGWGMKGKYVTKKEYEEWLRRQIHYLEPFLIQ